jgi:hypothetical protein
MQLNAGHIKSFLKAKTAEKLMKLMLENNVRKSSWHDYQIIYVDGFWYAWFTADINDLLKKG